MKRLALFCLLVSFPLLADNVGTPRVQGVPHGYVVTTTSATTATATAPTGGSLTAATATLVYAGSNTVCQISVSNLDAAIAMNCGQTNAVSATVGLKVAAGATYTTMRGYGGAIYCFPASGTPAYSVQINLCPLVSQ